MPSPAGSRSYLDITAGGNTPMYVIAFDLQSRAERNLGEVSWPGHVARSPDGSALAIQAPVVEDVRHVSVMTLDGGKVEPVFDLSPPAGRQGFVDLRGLDWTPDGEAVIVQILGAGRGGIWKVPLHGGDPQRVEGIEALYWRPVRLSPDGRNLAFMAGRTRGEIWVMEGITDGVGSGSGSR
jgi:Tol biopolymer transport system component